MRRIFTLFSTALLCAASAAAQTQINLATQANWNSLTGYGVPAGGTCPVTATGTLTAGSFTTTLSSSAGILANQAVLGTGVASGTLVSAINTTTDVVTVSKAFTTTGPSVSLRFYSYGQPYTDLTNNVQYVCAASGWVKQAPSSSVYPAAGIANSTGSAWGTSYGTTGTGTTVALSASPTFTGTLAINSTPTYAVNIAPLSTMLASWNFDTTTASSAFNSLGQSAITTDGTHVNLPSVLSAACLGTDSAGKIGVGTCTAGSLTVGSTTVASTTSGYVLYDNAGVLGGKAVAYEAPLLSIAYDDLGTGVAGYAPISGGANGVSTAEASAQSFAPFTCALGWMRVVLNGGDPGNLATVAVVLRDAGSSTLLTCTITGNGSTSTSCADTSHIVSITAGDLIDWRITPSAGLTYSGNLSISALWNCTQ